MSGSHEPMRLGKFEFLMMNNPMRRRRLRRKEFPIFLEMLRHQRIDLHGKAIMDAGCGSGYSTELIIKEFSPARITAFDFMPEQITLAARRGLNVEFYVGDARRMQAEDSSFDAVFMYAILHHIPEWKDVLRETHRVLKTGGVFLFEEPHRQSLDWPVLETGVEEAGLDIREKVPWLFGRFRSYLCQK